MNVEFCNAQGGILHQAEYHSAWESMSQHGNRLLHKTRQCIVITREHRRATEQSVTTLFIAFLSKRPETVVFRDLLYRSDFLTVTPLYKVHCVAPVPCKAEELCFDRGKYAASWRGALTLPAAARLRRFVFFLSSQPSHSVECKRTCHMFR